MILQYAIHNVVALHAATKAVAPHPRLLRSAHDQQVTNSLCEHLITKFQRKILDKTIEVDAYRYKGEIFIPGPNKTILMCHDGAAIPIVDVAAEDVEPPRVTEQSLASKLTSLSKSLASWASAGFTVVNDAQLAERHSICEACPFWEKDAFLGTGRCKKCGCSGVKLKLATSKCPIGKWDAINNS